MATKTKQANSVKHYCFGDDYPGEEQTHNDVDIHFDSKYYNLNSFFCSKNNHYGADFDAMDYTDSIYPAPSVNGYIKDGILHFSILEYRYTNFHDPQSYGERYVFPTNLNFVHRIMVDMHNFGNIHHIPKYTHLKYAVDWDNVKEHCEIHGSNSLVNRTNYLNARAKYILNNIPLGTILVNSDVPKIRDLKNKLSKLAKHDDGLTNPEVKNSLSKAISYIQNALFLKRHLGYHKKLQKAQHKKLKHKVMYLYHTKKLSINKTAKTLGISTPKVADLLGGTAYRI